MLQLRTILHPTDFSEHSRYAFQAACVLARECQARLIVLHVVEPPVTVVGGTSAVPPLCEELRLPEAEKHLHHVQPSDPDLDIEHRLEVGYPGETILRVARELPADLIVMGTHGRRGLSRLLMGSVAEQVLRDAGCPILTLKRPTHVKDTVANAALREAVEV